MRRASFCRACCRRRDGARHELPPSLAPQIEPCRRRKSSPAPLQAVQGIAVRPFFVSFETQPVEMLAISDSRKPVPKSNPGEDIVRSAITLKGGIDNEFWPSRGVEHMESGVRLLPRMTKIIDMVF